LYSLSFVSTFSLPLFLLSTEAHRAKGNYAYCTVVRDIRAVTRHFRILALSATPGADNASINEVVVFVVHVEVVIIMAKEEEIEEDDDEDEAEGIVSMFDQKTPHTKSFLNFLVLTVITTYWVCVCL
jgi:hypothetical protein